MVRQAAAGFVARLCSTWQLTSSATNLEESALQTVQGLRGLRGQVGPQVGDYVAGHVHEADAQDGYGDAARVSSWPTEPVSAQEAALTAERAPHPGGWPPVTESFGPMLLPVPAATATLRERSEPK